MSTHQLIFTSCRRGITGANDGQQIYSYDTAFPTDKLGLVRPLFSYKTPNLPAGVLMTEELVPTFPKSFSYKKLDSTAYDVVLNTYLGLDYMGSGGRFGNFLSHHIMFEKLLCYPAELFGSQSFRTSMNFEDVNRNETPAYLEAPKIELGNSISLDVIAAFLQSGDRIQIFNKMAACLLESAKSDKRILINDTTENIIKWIAALHYLLPLRCAENVSFSTYLYNPMESDWRIVGVVDEGTFFQAGNPSYIFDIAKGVAPDVPIDPEFAEFVEVGFTISTETLGDFHSFLDKEFPAYVNADEGMYGALAVYQLDIGLFDTLSLDQALTFLSAHGSLQQRIVFINKVFSQVETLALLKDSTMRNLVIDFLNSLGSRADDLLGITLDIEGHLLDSDGSSDVVAILWQNFYAQMLDRYQSESASVYRRLLVNSRNSQVLELFTLFLKNEGSGAPQEQFDHIMRLLSDQQQMPPYIDVYYKYAIEPEQRAHLLRFIMNHDVAFSDTAKLMCEALEPYVFGKLSNNDAEDVKSYWAWACGNQIDINRCGKLWGLIAGIYICSAQQTSELADIIDWVSEVIQTQESLSLPNTEDYIKWILPAVIVYTDSPASLADTIKRLTLRVDYDLLRQVSDFSVRHFQEPIWLKVAGYLFAFNNEEVLNVFAQASKKLSDHDLINLDTKIHSLYVDRPEFIRSWEYLFESIQNIGMRKLKGIFKKKDEDDVSHSKRKGRG